MVLSEMCTMTGPLRDPQPFGPVVGVLVLLVCMGKEGLVSVLGVTWGWRMVRTSVRVRA